jgi:lycopene cyclase domain-containing protein
MTYLGFHLVFLLPVIGVLAWLVAKGGRIPYPAPWLGTATLCCIAFVYTTPWDNYLVGAGIWTYDEGRVLEGFRLGYVPIEEYLFFVLQPILTALFLFFFAQRIPRPAEKALAAKGRRNGPRIAAGTTFAGIALLSAGGLSSPWEGGTYLCLILVWAAPVLSFQSFFGFDRIILYRRQWIPALVGSTAYLWLVDGIAIDWEIWRITEATSTGLHLFALPIEEALFFLATNLLVLFGLVLFQDVLLRQNTGKTQ